MYPIIVGDSDAQICSLVSAALDQYHYRLALCGGDTLSGQPRCVLTGLLASWHVSLFRCLKVQSSRLLSEHSSSSSSSSNSRHCRHKLARRKVSASAAGEKTKRGRGAPSSLQPPPPDDGTGRLKDFPFPPVIPGPQLDLPDPEGEDDEDEDEGEDEDQEEDGTEIESENEEEDEEEDPFEFPDDDIRAHGGYTPFEELDWSEEDITHELSIYVDAPRSKCFHMWQDRLNYLEWFDNIGQVRCGPKTLQESSWSEFYQAPVCCCATTSYLHNILFESSDTLLTFTHAVSGNLV